MLIPAVVSYFGQEELAKNASSTAKMVEFGLPFSLAAFFYALIASPHNNNFLNYTPSEIDFLFPAPFNRRDLLIYKLIGILIEAFFMCMFATAVLSMLLIRDQFWIDLGRGFIGLFLTLLFLRLTLILLGLVRESIVVRTFNPIRKVIVYGAGALLMIAGFTTLRQIEWEQLQFIQNPADIEPIVATFVNSTAGQILLGPFKIFSNLILANSWGDFALWGTVCLSVNALLLYLIVRCDANFLETSVLVSQQRAEVLKSHQSLETVFVSSSVGTLPMMPYWGGAGPVAWRQLQTFYRTWKVALFYVVLLFGTIGVLVWTSRNEVSSIERFGMVVSILGTITYAGSVAMPIGFQTDIDKMDILKSLPASSLQIAAGQLLGPVIVLTMLQYLYVFVFMFTALDQWPLWLLVVAVTPLINTIMLSLSNTFALLFPTRQEPGVVKQFEGMGTIVIFMFSTTCVSMVLFFTAVGAGGLAWYLTGVVAIGALMNWVVMLVFSFLGVRMTGWAFERFDVSKQKI